MNDSEPLKQIAAKAYADGKVWIYATSPEVMEDRVTYALIASLRTTLFLDEEHFFKNLPGIDPEIARSTLATVSFESASSFKTKP